MKPIGAHNYYIYITTNFNKTVLYTGITNDLERRISEHKYEAQNATNKFTGKYKCYYLLYYERYDCVNDAIYREKEIKGWTRKKKESLINTQNPNWDFIEFE